MSNKTGASRLWPCRPKISVATLRSRISRPKGNSNDNRICNQILESDPAIRVAAFIEGAEVTGYAETARTKNVLSQSGDLRKKIGFWVSIITEMARQTDKLLGTPSPDASPRKG